MRVNIQAITPSTMRSVEPEAAKDLFWQTACLREDIKQQEHDPVFAKQIWMQNAHLTWGICGYTAFVDNGDASSNPVPAATVFFAPTSYLPGVEKLPSGPVSADAILLSTVHLSDAYMGLYLEHQLIDTVIAEASRRGVKAIEAFARAEDFDDSVIQAALGVGKPKGGNEATSVEPAAYEASSPDKLRKPMESVEQAARPVVDEVGKTGDQGSSEASQMGEKRRAEAPGGVHSGSEALTPLQELQFIPEAYRGWNHHPGFREVKGSEDSNNQLTTVRGAGDQRSAAGDKRSIALDQESSQGPSAKHRTESKWGELEWAPLLSEDILEAEGFSIVAHHPNYPRYRRELPEATSLFGKFEQAEHAQLNGPEQLHTVLGGEHSYLSPLRSEHPPGLLGGSIQRGEGASAGRSLGTAPWGV
ncbi:hypothetical protein [uncultured Corynebacterium sp.]|uniref:hypothetical protein n=1 Tax=uncultured Corynebacterium sp. TaxID=159447 RepID=UPI0025D50679|nr:hypothetical protein [uncultured Corynebacterium sp.]